MKQSVLALVALIFYVSSFSQSQNPDKFNKRIADIEDRIAIKNLVDTFSILADQKDIQKQIFLFTEDATVESTRSGNSSVLKGRKQIGDAFESFLRNFETVYHINGQQTLSLNGDKAIGISYCFVVLIANQNGKLMKTSMGVYYNDEFIRQNGRWLIAKRKSTFAWTDQQPLGQ